MKEAIIYLTVTIVIMAWVGLTVIIASRSYTNGFNEGYEFGKNVNESPKKANDNVINEENLEAKKKQIANAFGVPETVLEEIDGTWPPTAKENEDGKRSEEV